MKNIILASFFLLFVAKNNAQSGSQSFITSGVFTVPAGVNSVKIEVVGAGGNGGGNGGGGGGGGGYASGTYSVTPLSALTVTVGAAGGGAVAGTSSVSTFIAASGGGNGTIVSNPNIGGGGAGGTGTGGTIANFTGGTGGGGYWTYFGGGGGGAAGASGNGNNGGNTIVWTGFCQTPGGSAGTGGGAPGGGGGKGAGFTDANCNISNPAANGSNYGGGAGGGNGNGGNPGSGAGGYVHISWCNPTAGTDTISACGFYAWIDGHIYATSNNSATYTIVGGASNGCDSIVTLHLTIHYSSTGIDTQTACNSFTWIDGNTYTASNTTATDTLTNAAGCDSIVTLHLQIIPTILTSLSDGVCEGYSYFFNGQNIALAGSYSDTLTVLGGCDSIVQLTLYTIPSQTTTVDTAIIQGNSYTLPRGNVVTIQGTYRDTLTASNTCDSIVITNLSIISSISGSSNENTGIAIYPNLLTNQLMVTSNGTRVSEINIYNNNGDLVTQTKQPTNYYVDISQLAAGVYIAEIKTKEAGARIRWVKL